MSIGGVWLFCYVERMTDIRLASDAFDFGRTLLRWRRWQEDVRALFYRSDQSHV